VPCNEISIAYLLMTLLKAACYLCLIVCFIEIHAKHLE
jgi:hypothetical protein